MTDRGEGDAPPRTLDPEVIFAAVDGWLAMTGQPSPEAEPGSALAGDTAKSSKHQVSHAAWNGITHAVDQLHALKTLIVDARVVHLRPLQPLAFGDRECRHRGLASFATEA